MGPMEARSPLHLGTLLRAYGAAAVYSSGSTLLTLTGHSREVYSVAWSYLKFELSRNECSRLSSHDTHDLNFKNVMYCAGRANPVLSRALADPVNDVVYMDVPHGCTERPPCP